MEWEQSIVTFASNFVFNNIDFEVGLHVILQR